MPDAAWKAFERFVAKEMGGERRGADYGDSRGGKNDIILDGWSIEVKKLKTPAWGHMTKAVSQAVNARESVTDIAVAIVAKKNRDYSDCLVVMDLEQLKVIKQAIDRLEDYECGAMDNR